MSNTLVIIIAEPRAHELTYNNIKENVIDRLDADLCVCIGVKPNYDYKNAFYQNAKYRFLYEEQDAFNGAFDNMYQEIVDEKIKPLTNKYEIFNDTNFLFGKLSDPKISNDNIVYLGDYENVDSVNFDELDYEEIVYHTPEFDNTDWKKGLYGIKHSLKNSVPLTLS